MNEKRFIADDLELMSEWDFEENRTLDPQKLTRGSNKRPSWICQKCGHKWKTAIHHRSLRGTGCPQCRHSKRKNYNSTKSLFDTHPNIAANWHPINNGSFTPNEFTKGSRFNAHWKCKTCNYEWEQSIQRYKGCAECRKASVLERNNLAINYPELIKEWDHSKNFDIQPTSLSFTSDKKTWWVCSKCKYEWKARISNRAVLDRGCPACANKVVVKGANDLSTTHPELAKEWNYEKNATLRPTDFSYGTAKKVWWICSQGHEYPASILHRVHGTNCPKCHSGRQTSFAEQAVYYYVKKMFPDAISRYSAKFLGRMELDIYIPSIKYAIEYDGAAWHKKETVKREQKKYLLCQQNGIKLIRLREKMPEIGSEIADYMYSTENLYQPKALTKILTEILRRINFSSSWLHQCPVDINIERDRFEIQQYRTIIKSNSLEEQYPDIATEWHPNKNQNLTPRMFPPGSDQKVWWKCSFCTNEYQASIGHRTNGTGCPVCAIEKVTAMKRKAVSMIDADTGETLQTFISISDASRKMNINGSNITMVCKGKRRIAGGYCWRYCDKN